MTNRAKCIYCLRQDTSFQGREHVIPQFLGTFPGNSLLLKSVCDGCNSGFSKLESIFKEDSIEGFIASQYQIRDDSSIRFRKDRMKFRRVSGDQQSVFNSIFPFIEPSTGLTKAISQIVFDGSNGKSIVFLPKGFNDAKRFAKKLNWTGQGSPRIHIFAKGEEAIVEIISMLHQRGITYRQIASEQFSSTKQDFADFEFEARIDITIKRVIAKIAFNYFALSAIESGLQDCLYESNFDTIREMALGKNPSNIVEVLNEGLCVTGFENRAHIPFHLIRIFESQNSIWSELSLFGHLRYRVRIGSYQFLTCDGRAFGAGHQFNLLTRTFHREDIARYCIASPSEFSLFSNV